jgi:hypothetical protein
MVMGRGGIKADLKKIVYAYVKCVYVAYCEDCNCQRFLCLR